MEKLYDMKEEAEKVILVAVSDGDDAKVNESLDELEELVSTAGAITVGRMTQNSFAETFGQVFMPIVGDLLVIDEQEDDIENTDEANRKAGERVDAAIDPVSKDR